MATFTSAADRARSTANDTIAHLHSATKTAVSGAKDVANELTDAARKQGADAIDTATKYGKDTMQSASDMTQNAVSATQKQMDVTMSDLGDFVRQNPIAALAAAAGIGFLIGAMRRH